MNLTPAQQRAVTTESTDVLCLAGAGSGKTRVLVERCVHLIRDRGRSPSEIMVLTFTRKAAGEVRDRLQKRLEEFWGRKTTAELRPMLIGTFHAVSLSIVRSHLELLGYQNEVSVITENDSVKVLGQVCVDLGYRIGDNYRIGLSFDQISRAIGSYYSSGRFPVFRENRQMEACIRIMREYHARLRSMSALDFGLILAEAKRLLDEFVAPRNEWQHRIRAVLVDEIQDTDEVQFDLHSRFCPPAEFFGVGDRRQSIYRFRGARPDLMTERHPNAEIIDLQENFRSGRRVVEAANRLIHHNGDMLAAPMSCSTGREGNVQVITGRSDDLARMANALLVRYQPQEMAVMARSHRLLRRLESVFRDAGIPVHRVGAAFDVCESDSFLSLLAAMRLMTNPRDNLAFASLRDDLKVGSRAYADLRAHADLKGCSHFFAYLDSVPKSSGLDSMLRDQSVGQMNADVFADLFCSATLRKRDMSVTFWREIAPKMDVKTAVLWYGTRDSQDDLGPGDRVMLLTAHAAKGLEWPVVVVANMNEGVFPSKQALKDLDGDREERRLAYVAMTRARESLILHYRRPEDQSGPNFQPASRFIREAIGDADGSQDDEGVRSLRGNPQRGVLPSDCQEGRGAAQPGSVGGDRPGSGSLPEGAGAGSEVHRPGSFAAGQGEQQ